MSQPTLKNLQSPKTRGRDVRIGPASLFTLVVIVCMAVLVVLAASTAHATLVMSMRMAASTHDFYVDERVGQVLLSNIDSTLGDARAASKSADAAASELESALPEICASATSEAKDEADVTASLEGRRLNAEITCNNGRVLKIGVTILDDATYRIDKWEMTAVENEEQPTGNLWTGA